MNAVLLDATAVHEASRLLSEAPVEFLDFLPDSLRCIFDGSEWLEVAEVDPFSTMRARDVVFTFKLTERFTELLTALWARNLVER
jgi:hypothetical protein